MPQKHDVAASSPAFSLTIEQLEAMIGRAVEKHAKSGEPEREVLTFAQTCDLLQQSKKGLYSLIDRGMPAHKLGSDWRFRRTEVLKWLSEQKRVA